MTMILSGSVTLRSISESRKCFQRSVKEGRARDNEDVASRQGSEVTAFEGGKQCKSCPRTRIGGCLDGVFLAGIAAGIVGSLLALRCSDLFSCVELPLMRLANCSRALCLLVEVLEKGRRVAPRGGGRAVFSDVGGRGELCGGGSGQVMASSIFLAGLIAGDVVIELL